MEFCEHGIGLHVQQRDADLIYVYVTASLSNKTLLHVVG
jgi:hypothetical protein